MPEGSTLQVSWTQLSGPGVVTFADPASAATTATMPGVGVFDLRLTATDGTLSYWALGHPAARPDFHDRRGFLLRLAPASPTGGNEP